MSDEALLWGIFFIMFVYVCIIMILVVIVQDRSLYTKTLYKGLESILQNSENKIEGEILRQIEWFYEKYIQSNPGARKYYPNFISWIDFIMLQVILKRKSVKKISQYESLLNKMIENYENANPFIKCSDYQQELLQDMEKLLDENNEIPLSNIIHRTEEEFTRLSADIKKNDKFNKLSIAVGAIGIFVSIMTAVIHF